MVAYDNPGSEMSDLMRRVRILETQSGADGAGFGGGTDGSHEGSGGSASLQIGQLSTASANLSVALGYGTDATALGSVAVGASAQSWAFGSVALGRAALASHDSSMALGYDANAVHSSSTAVGTGAVTTAADQVMLGTADHTVVVPGTFSNPSARRLKRNIVPAPCLRSIFPTQYEWEYIADEKRRRHVGPIADELLGTDAERFLTFDDDGAVAGIDKLGLYGAQIAVLLARIESLEEELRGRNG
jgi:hypothetical protein